MEAVVIKEHLKDISQLELSHNVPIPKPKNGEVLIKVKCASLNFFDILQSKGKYQTQPPLPFILGFEYSGTVVEDMTGTWEKGDRVFGGAQGAFAEYIVVPATQLLPIPENLTFEEASTLFITAPTSYLAIVYRGQVKEGDTVLVHAAAGGVGLHAVQISKAMGAKVIATASSKAKLDICRKYGADFLVNYKDHDWIDQIKKITKGKGCDIIFDPVGLVESSLKVVAFNGRILVIGFAAGKIEDIKTNKLLLKSASLVGVFWGGTTIKQPEIVPSIWLELLEMIRTNKLKAVCYDRIYDGLESVQVGLRALGSRETYGKVVVRVKSSSQTRSAKL